MNVTALAATGRVRPARGSAVSVLSSAGLRGLETMCPPGAFCRRAIEGAPATATAGSAYPELGYPLDEFDLVYAYPWGGEEELMIDLMRRYRDRDATLLLYGGGKEMRAFCGGRPMPLGKGPGACPASR